MDADTLFTEAMKLPSIEREDLASRLYESIDSQGDAPPLDPAWDEEIARRVEEVRSGKVKTIPADEVFRRLRAITDA